MSYLPYWGLWIETLDIIINRRKQDHWLCSIIWLYVKIWTVQCICNWILVVTWILKYFNNFPKILSLFLYYTFPLGLYFALFDKTHNFDHWFPGNFYWTDEIKLSWLTNFNCNFIVISLCSEKCIVLCNTMSFLPVGETCQLLLNGYVKLFIN